MNHKYLQHAADIFIEDSLDGRIGKVVDYCERLEAFLRNAEKALLESTNGYIHPDLVAFVTRVCASTRDLAFHVDFGCSLHRSAFVREFAMISSRVSAAIASAQDCLIETARLLKAVQNEKHETILHYAASCENRLKRIDSIIDGDLLAAFRMMIADLPYPPTQEQLVKIATLHDGFLLTTASWLTHRLIWVVCELGLESGPFAEALSQQFNFLKEESDLLSILRSKLSQKFRDDYMVELKPHDSVFLEQIRHAIDYVEDCTSRLEIFLRDQPVEIEAKEVTHLFLEDILAFVRNFENEKEEYCASLNQSSDTTQPTEISNVRNIRVLLVDEDLGCEERKWSAIGLDVRVVGFGPTENVALESISELITSELAFQNAMMNEHRTTRISRDLLSKFESAQHFCTQESTFKLCVRKYSN